MDQLRQAHHKSAGRCVKGRHNTARSRTPLQSKGQLRRQGIPGASFVSLPTASHSQVWEWHKGALTDLAHCLARGGKSGWALQARAAEHYVAHRLTAKGSEERGVAHLPERTSTAHFPARHARELRWIWAVVKGVPGRGSRRGSRRRQCEGLPRQSSASSLSMH